MKKKKLEIGDLELQKEKITSLQNAQMSEIVGGISFGGGCTTFNGCKTTFADVCTSGCTDGCPSGLNSEFNCTYGGNCTGDCWGTTCG